MFTGYRGYRENTLPRVRRVSFKAIDNHGRQVCNEGTTMGEVVSQVQPQMSAERSDIVIWQCYNGIPRNAVEILHAGIDVMV